MSQCDEASCGAARPGGDSTPPGDVSPDEGEYWRRAAGELSDWAMEHLAARRDAHGHHYSDIDSKTGDVVTRRCFVHGPVTRELLVRHFAATATDDVQGLLVATLDEECLWLVVDVDNHADDPALIAVNRAYALLLHDRARVLGITPLLFDTNGRGSFHVWCLLGGLAPQADTWKLAYYLARDWADHGLPGRPDLYPRKPAL